PQTPDAPPAGSGGGGPAHTPEASLGAAGSAGTAPAGAVPAPMLPSQAAALAQGVRNASSGVFPGATAPPAGAGSSSSVGPGAQATSKGQSDPLVSALPARGPAGQAAAQPGAANTHPAPPDKSAVIQDYVKSVVSYAPNVGQSDPSVHFVAQ